MKAAVLTAHGKTNEVVQYITDLPIPEPKRGEVRVQVKACALNRLDLWVREGWRGLHLDFPHVVCADGAGIVDAVGDDVTNIAVGDRVSIDPSIADPNDPAYVTGLENQSRIQILGEHTAGTAAEFIVVPARNLLKMPDHVEFTVASSAGLVFVTAWHSLITRGGLRAGESVLIVGAGGGVNTASISIAKLAGATVYVVGSDAEKCAKAKALGADFTIDRSEVEDWSKAMFQLTGKRGVDIVVDNVGSATLYASMRSVRIGGRILIVGNTSGPLTQVDLRLIFGKHISIIGSTMGPHQDYVRVMNLIFEGKLQPAIGAVLPLSEIQEAQDILEHNKAFGKVVLELE